MRIYQQKKILELVKTLIEANADIKQTLNLLPERKKLDLLLADCQEFAIAIGNFIESIEGEGTKTVESLEEYCELLFQMHTNPDDAVLEEIKGCTVNIQNSVESELRPNRIEVLFLPYMAAMSDSLESIWKAALADPNCDTYIVPIPYYEYKAEGTIVQMHYEGNMYPKDVPITNWHTYDIESRHPDVIFIHYPYDNNNYITSIHPDFYSKKLKNYTDLLVYVPYFVSGVDIPEHLIVSPGTMYSNKVIVQSEEIRQTYIRVFKQFEKENQCENVYGNPEEKFLALGSPKFDRVLSTTRESCILPDEWFKLLQQRDGIRKKVVLYNTTISAILQGDEQYLNKIKSVLASFRKRTDVVLWWRPHPLSEATYASMLPEFYDMYERIVIEYKGEGLGIYDDTPDLHRAIAWSDVYYGDAGSVVSLYEKTNKPILYQDRTLNGFAAESIVFFLSMSIYKNKMYSFLYNRNAILETDLSNLRVNYFGCIPEKQIYKLRMYNYSRIIGDTLYMVPFMDHELILYDFRTKQFEKYELELLPQYITLGMGNFCNLYLYNNRIFLIPFGYRAIVSYDLITRKTEHYPIPEELTKLRQDSNIYGIFQQYELIDENRLLLPFHLHSTVAEFNLEKGTMQFHKIGEFSFGFNSISKYGDFYWLLGLNKLTVAKWNYETGEQAFLTSFPEGCINGTVCFGSNEIIRIENFLYCFPSRSNMVIKINLDNDEISRVTAFDPYCYRDLSENDKYCFGGATVTYKDGVYVIYAIHKAERLIEYNTHTEMIRELKLPPEFSDNDLQRMCDDYLDSLVNGYETVAFTSEMKSKVNKSHTAGERIYEHMKNLIT